MASEEKHVDTVKTLFVRNLPFSATNEKLETLFGDIGPVKKCFVVKDKGSEHPCRGFGYVTFAWREDAQSALEKIKSLDGRKLILAFANKKPKKKKKQEAQVQTESGVPEVITEKKTSVSKEKHLASCTVVVTDVPTHVSLSDLKESIKDLNKVTNVEYPVKEREKNTAFLRFENKNSAVKGLKKVNKLHIQGQQCHARLLSQENVKMTQKALKRARIIIRNLSFKCTSDNLWEAFTDFGEISEVVIPTSKDGKNTGFGFVQFISLKVAGRAIQEMNGKKILGRPVAVDWAVAKDKFQTAKESQTQEESEDEGSFSGNSGEESDSSNSDVEMKEDSKKRHMSDSDDESDASSHDSERSEESQDESESDDESDKSGDSDSDEGFSDSSSTDGEQKAKDKKSNKPTKSDRKSDVDEGRTLFIRNLSFDSEEDDVAEFFAEYGKLKYCRLVLDRETEHPKGTAFVQFKDKADAEKCFADANAEEGGFSLDGRQIFVIKAVARNKAEELRKLKKEKEPKDKRNLHLAREGMIRPGTQYAQGLSQADLAKRMKVERVKREKLKNPSIFISATRLCVRNLPTQVDDKQLKKIFLKAVGDNKAHITESRIMRDRTQISNKNIAKSKGFAFVNFTEHEHALQALRATNNDPNIFGEKKRLIVEFSLENKAAVNARQKRIERVQAKQEAKKRTKNEDVDEAAPSKKRQKKAQPKPTQVVAPPTGTDGKRLPKGLPSHWGPKVRHKARVQDSKGKKKKPGMQQNPRVIQKPIPTQRNANTKTNTHTEECKYNYTKSKVRKEEKTKQEEIQTTETI